MYFDYTPSEHSIAKMKRIADYREKGMIWKDIAKEMGFHRTYVIALYGKYKQMKGGSISAS